MADIKTGDQKQCSRCMGWRSTKLFYGKQTICKPCLIPKAFVTKNPAKEDTKTETASPVISKEQIGSVIASIKPDAIDAKDVPEQLKPLLRLMNEMIMRISKLEKKVSWLPEEKPKSEILDAMLEGKPTGNMMFDSLLGIKK